MAMGFKVGQGQPCVTGVPKMIFCKFGTNIFKNMDSVAKMIFGKMAKRTKECPEWMGVTQITSKVCSLLC